METLLTPTPTWLAVAGWLACLLAFFSAQTKTYQKIFEECGELKQVILFKLKQNMNKETLLFSRKEEFQARKV